MTKTKVTFILFLSCEPIVLESYVGREKWRCEVEGRMSREKENFLFHFHLHTFVTHIAEKVKMKLQKQFLQNNYKRKGFQLSFLRENNPLIKAESIFISDFSLKIYWGSVFMCRTRKCVKHDSIKIFLLFSTREKPEKNLNRKTWNIINLGRSENHFFFFTKIHRKLMNGLGLVWR